MKAVWKRHDLSHQVGTGTCKLRNFVTGIFLESSCMSPPMGLYWNFHFRSIVQGLQNYLRLKIIYLKITELKQYRSSHLDIDIRKCFISRGRIGTTVDN
jgi:hypothetical protein